jgi:hypothetical protein
LGFTIDTALFTVKVPENKLNRIKKILSEFLLSRRHKVRVIAIVLGKLISFKPALGKSILVGTRLATIAVVAATEVSDESKRRRSPWESRITLDSETMEAMSAVRSQLDAWNGFPIRTWHTGITLSSILPSEATALYDRKIPARRVQDQKAIMASKASNLALASYLVEGLPEFSFSESLEESEREESSSFRELMAIYSTLVHMATSPSGYLKVAEWMTLWWLTDNQNVKKMIAKGSDKLKITRLVLKILKVGRELRYNVQPIWVSRDNPFLQKADCLSKGIYSVNWQIAELD